MKSSYDILGNHIRLVDERNGKLLSERVLGINIDKFFMPSVANVIGTDLSKYKLITQGRFACNPMHVGRDERLPVALYTDSSPAIVSPAYFMFEITDKTVLNDEFLMMWFRRPEFDRICWLKTDGSVRGGISWDDICRIEVPVLPYDEQLRIVQSYKAITERIELKRKINDNLVQTADAIFQRDFIQHPQYETQKKACFADFILTSTGGDWGQDSPSGNYTEKVACIRGTDIPSLNTGSISDAPIRYILPKNLDTKRIRANNIVVEISGGSPVQATGRIAIVPEQVLKYRGDSIICSNFCKVISVKEDYVFFFLQYWLYLYRNGRMFDYENSSTGLKNFDFTAFITKESIPFPQRDQIVSFNAKLKQIYTELFCAGFEIEVLQKTQKHVLSHIMLNGV